jgi:cytochrome c
MDGFELNKIAGALLSAMLVIAGGRVLLDIAMPHHAPAKPGWALPVTEAKPKEAAAPETAFDVTAVLGALPKANADAGAGIFKKCMACHTPNKGDRNLVGPNLWGIVGRKVATATGFEARYSDAMKGFGGAWTWDRLATYLHKPAAAMPGNKMVFDGVKDDADLADLLAYLRKLSDNPPALPK